LLSVALRLDPARRRLAGEEEVIDLGRRTSRLYVVACGVSTEPPKWDGQQPYISEGEAAERRAEWQELLRKLYPGVVQDAEGVFPPMLIQSVSKEEDQMARSFEEALRPVEKPRTASELFEDLAGKVAPSSVKQFKTAKATRSPDGNSITVDYLNTGKSKTVKRVVQEYPDRVVSAYELTFSDGGSIKETVIRFKEKAPEKTETNGDGREFDEDFEPMSVGMWRSFIRRYVRFFPANLSFCVDNVSYLVETFRAPCVGTIRLEKVLDERKHPAEPFLSNLASKMRYIQTVKQMRFDDAVKEHLPVLLAHIDHFNED